jgi:hypothetical protein
MAQQGRVIASRSWERDQGDVRMTFYIHQLSMHHSDCTYGAPSSPDLAILLSICALKDNMSHKQGYRVVQLEL